MVPANDAFIFKSAIFYIFTSQIDQNYEIKKIFFCLNVICDGFDCLSELEVLNR